MSADQDPAFGLDLTADEAGLRIPVGETPEETTIVDPATLLPHERLDYTYIIAERIPERTPETEVHVLDKVVHETLTKLFQAMIQHGAVVVSVDDTTGYVTASCRATKRDESAKAQ